MSNIDQELAERLPVQGRTDEAADANHPEQPDPEASTELGAHGEPLKWHTELHDSHRPEHRYGEEHYGSTEEGHAAGGYAGGHQELSSGIENVSLEAPARHHEGLQEEVELGSHGEPLKWHTELHDSHRPEHRYGEEHYGSPEAGRAGGGYAGGHKEQHSEMENVSPEPPARHHEGLLEKVRRKIQGKKQQEGAAEEGSGSSSSESDGEGGRRKKKYGLF